MKSINPITFVKFMKYLAIFASLLVGLSASHAQNTDPAVIKSGEQIYKQTCVACHSSGVANAPKFGDKKTWMPLIAEGQHVLTAHAWVGVRGMPPKGGRSDLTLEEFASATAYMARAAGGKWTDPDAKMLAKIRQEEQLRISSLKSKK
jgi:cytochrome c5